MASLRDRIEAEIARRLGLIIAGNPAGKPGTVYANTMASVQRWELEGNNRSSLPVAIVSLQEERYSYSPTQQVTNELSVSVEVCAAHDRTANPGSTDAYVSSLLRDVLLALLADPQLKEGGAGQVLATKIEPVISFPLEDEEGHAFCGFVAEFAVQYQTALDDPDFYV